MDLVRLIGSWFFCNISVSLNYMIMLRKSEYLHLRNDCFQEYLEWMRQHGFHTPVSLSQQATALTDVHTRAVGCIKAFRSTNTLIVKTRTVSCTLHCKQQDDHVDHADDYIYCKICVHREFFFTTVSVPTLSTTQIIFNGYPVYIPWGQKCEVMKPIPHLQLVLMSEKLSYTSTPPYSFIAHSLTN
jgi:hypothetical protein